eukprot:scaffold7337_cov66-Skeletonema_dohrnii-CCMP3373.AAC.11
MPCYSKAIAAIIMASTIQIGLTAAPCDLLTQDAFDAISPDATFPYSYSGFCTAVTNWNTNNPSNQIFMGATEADQKAELSAFMGNIRHESDDLKAAREYYICQVQTTVNDKVYCKPSGYNGGPYNDPYCSTLHTPTSDPAGCACTTIPESTAAPGYLDADLLFLGRGAMQLSWNYNYFYAGADLNVDLCTNPDLVATDEEVNWGTAIWFWTTSTGSTGTTCKEYVEAGSFGGTVKTINGGLECPAAASHYGSVVGRLNDYCIAANVLSVDNLLSLGECSGLQGTFDACKLAGSCPACNGENPPPPSPPPPSPGPGGNHNYCGLSWADANSQCGESCYGGTNEECSSGLCYADATSCPTVYDGTPQPTSQPTHAPSNSPTTAAPSPSPTPGPSNAPTSQPTAEPTSKPTTSTPTSNPTPVPTKAPVTDAPTALPTPVPSNAPTPQPTLGPTSEPTTSAPSSNPTPVPTKAPVTDAPTALPTPVPTENPTEAPTNQPTNIPTTALPTQPPTAQPTNSPTTPSPTPVPTPLPTNQPIPGSAGWYVDGDMCTLGQSTQTLYTSATACCTDQLSWMSNELCVSLSTGVPTNMFYADQIASVCKQDCPAGNGLPCGGSPSDLSLTLYSSIELCCATKIPWEPSCVDKSNGNEPQGTGKYYVNWSYGKCALDCPEGSAAGCGGVASSWDVKHDTQAACCSAISWVSDSECVYGATTTTSTTGATTTPTSGTTDATTTTTTTTQVTATGWYVDGDMCTLGQSTQTLYTSATACCTNQLSWMSNDLCVSISTGVPTNMFYADQIASVCKQDCPAGNGLPCGGSPSDLSLTLYSSLASCCSTKIPWEPSCVDKSNGDEPQ